MKHVLKIKVCGMRQPDNIRALGQLRPDYMGLIFYPPSPRYVDRLAPSPAERTLECIRTGVFVDASVDEVKARIQHFELGALQLHGAESSAYCARVRAFGLPIIKAVGVSPATDWKNLISYQNTVDYLLFDTKSEAHGGTGQQFDWDLLQRYELEIPYFLSGGIGPGDIPEVLAHAAKDRRCYGIDLNSRYEHVPGIKNTALLKETFTNIRLTNHE